MRTIKSQDGKTIVTAEKSQGFYANIFRYPESKVQYRIYDHSFGSIAEYSTEKRALRVLNMLNEWLIQPGEAIFTDVDLNDDLKREQIFNKLKTQQLFIMPQDSGELDA